MPRKLVKTTDITREEWLEYRRTGLGGSDAAVVMGLTPYRSKIELWADKTGRMPEAEDNEAMRTGRDLEQYVAERFCEAAGKKVRRRNYIFQHDEYDFITARMPDWSARQHQRSPKLISTAARSRCTITASAAIT